jgi:transcriptional regulator with XRE-family HTH domain
VRKLEQSIPSRTAVPTALAKNLSLARAAKGFTQTDLAKAAGGSPATIAQLEVGEGDPRLSTIIDLATALDTSPMLLLMGEDELGAIANISNADSLLSDDQVQQMRRLVSSGLLKQRLQAGKLGAIVAQGAGLSAVGAAIGSGLLPGIGTAVGAAIGAYLIARSIKRED